MSAESSLLGLCRTCGNTCKEYPQHDTPDVLLDEQRPVPLLREVSQDKTQHVGHPSGQHHRRVGLQRSRQAGRGTKDCTDRDNSHRLLEIYHLSFIIELGDKRRTPQFHT